MEREFISLNIAMLAIADDPAAGEPSLVKLIADRLQKEGHHIVSRDRVNDDEGAIRGQLKKSIDDPKVDVVIAAGDVESEAASGALAPLITKPLAGFIDLFRLVAFQEIGAAAVQSNAEAAECGSTVVFVLPASVGAVTTAMDKLLVPQLDHRTKPRNLVMTMPRVKALAAGKPAAKPVIPAIPAIPAIPSIPSIPSIPKVTKPHSIPEPIENEKTEAGVGLVKRLPAVLPRKPDSQPPQDKPMDDAPTRVMALEKLLPLMSSGADEATFDAPTRETTLLGLSAAPPGADEFSDDDTDNDVKVAPPKVLPIPPLRTIIPRSQRGSSTPPAAKPRISGVSDAVPVEVVRRGSLEVHVATAPTAVPPPSTSAAPPAPPTGEAAPPARPSDASSRAAALAAARATEAARVAARDNEVTRVADVARVEELAAASAVEDVAESDVVESADQPASPSSSSVIEELDDVSIMPEPAPPARSLASPVRTTPLPKPIEPGTATGPRAVVARTASPTAPDARGSGSFNYPVKRKARRGRTIAVLGSAFVLAVAAFFAVVRWFPDHNASTSGKPVERVAETAVPVADAALIPPADAMAVDSAVVVDNPSPDAAQEEIAMEVPVPPPPPPAREHRAKPAPSSATHTTKPHPSDPPIELKPPPPSEPPPPPPPAPPEAKPAPVAETKPAADPGCDEMQCVMDHYGRPCCEKYKPADPGFKPKSVVRDSLDRTMVMAAVDKVKPRVIACGEKNPVKGTVMLSLTVGSEGDVQDVTVKSTPDPGLGTCVATAMRKAKFGKTTNGGTFNYPFVF